MTESGAIQFSAVLDGINAKGSGTVVQLKPDGYVTPEDVADLYRLRGRTVAVQIVDPDAALPLKYEEEHDATDAEPLAGLFEGSEA